MRTPTLAIGVALCAPAVLAGTALAGAGIAPITTVRVATGLEYTTFVTYAPGDYDRLYILQKPGRIRVLNLTTGLLNPAPFLDIDAIVGGGTSTLNEQGLLGLAFHPNYPATNEFFVNYTNNSGNTEVSKYTTISPDVANPTGDVILTFAQPFSNHNGGWLAFGPNDGYLYCSTGDGGGGGDTLNNGQNVNVLLGKMLRIDVNGDDYPANPSADYAIPPMNPFAGGGGAPEIWAYGLRNPWRCSFDRANGDLYMGDVGQGAWEEISYQRGVSVFGGQNYGWRCREGMHDFNFTGNCPVLSLVEPILEYGHGTGTSITGGYVYRGCAIPSLQGAYFFADYNSWQIWSFNFVSGFVTNLTNRTSELVPALGSIERIAAFGEDAAGEMYIVDQGSGATGEIYKIVPVTPTADLDCSGDVGFSDILILLGAWGPCPAPPVACPADLDEDGSVGFSDLLIMLGSWG